MKSAQTLPQSPLQWLKLTIHFAVPIILFFMLFLLMQPQSSSQAAAQAFSCVGIVGIPEAECDVLVALYNSTDGANWITNTNWLVTNTPCSWYGVVCDAGQVNAIGLSNNQLRGVIPSQLGNLTQLQRLFLSNNQLIGNIPPELGNLIQLQQLFLFNNQLSGGIPPELGNLTQLQLLYLTDNQLSGNIPPELGNLTQLQALILYRNQISGNIPPELGNLTQLQVLSLYINQLNGNIPPELGNLPQLQYLLLGYNRLSGLLPSSIMNLPKPLTLDLRFNMLSCEEPVCTFVEESDPNWRNSQTVPPTNMQVLNQSATSVDLGWTPISYTDDGGGYEVSYTTQPGGPYVVHGITGDKTALTYTIGGLCPGQTYFFAVRTYTPHHTEQPNDLHSDFGQPLSVTTFTDQSSLKLLTIYLLALDNNLSEERNPILREIRAATADPTSCSKGALVLADQKGDQNTQAFFIQGNTTKLIEGLPDPTTNQINLALNEYDMADGAQLGAFIKWGRQQHPTAQTILTFVGHGLPLVPSTDVSPFITNTISSAVAPDDNIFPLPGKTRIYAHADQLTDAQSKSLISPHALAEALRIGTDDGQNLLTVLDIAHCFGGTIEEFYEVSPYAQVLIGAPNYTYSSGLMLGRALLAMQPGQSARYMAEAIIDAYDQTLAEADQADAQPLKVDHPRVLVALHSNRLVAIKTSVDQLAKALKQTLLATPDAAKMKIAAAQQDSQKYDTTLCTEQNIPQDWTLNEDDALSDVADFATQLSQQFILSPTVALTATNVVSAVNAAVIKTIKVSGTPWFAKNAELYWEFRNNISGIGLYTDFHGMNLHNDGIISLGWQAHWYNKGGEENADNPHPLAFIQGDSTTWADVLVDFWRGRENGIQTVVCTVEFPKVRSFLVFFPVIER